MAIDMFGCVHGGVIMCSMDRCVKERCLCVCPCYAPVFAVASAWVKQSERLFISDVDMEGWPSSMARRRCQGFAQTGRKAMDSASLRKNASAFGS